MMETLKTLILTVLVAASLIQSYLLAYSAPKFDAIIPVDYVESRLEGTRSEINDLIYPKDIVLHLGQQEHSILYPRMIFYQMILDVVKLRSFDGLREATDDVDLLGANNGERQGIEIRFYEELPLSFMKQIINIQGDTEALREPVDRIQIVSRSEREEVRVFFYGSKNKVVYEAVNADLTVRDVARFVGFGETGTRYVPAVNGHYLPADPLPMVTYRYAYREFTADQLQQSLFPDPFNTRNLRERDGSEIYTDGKRGLQISTERRWLSYTDPAAPTENEQNEWNSALSAVQFVNRHGGWNGEYMIKGLEENAESASDQTILFRQYLGTYPGAYPVISLQDGNPFGSIQLTLRNGNVTGYERSLIQLQGEPTYRVQTELPGGETLWKWVADYPDIALVESVFPAYRASFTGKEMLLEPIWALEMTDGSFRELPIGGWE